MRDFTCGGCRGRLQVQPEHVGMVVACPHCGAHVNTGGVARAPAAQAQRAPGPAPAAASAPVPARTRETQRRLGKVRGGRGAARVGRTDPPTNGGVILAIAGVALLLCFGPYVYLAAALQNPGEFEEMVRRFSLAALVPCASFPLYVTAWTMGSTHRSLARRAGVPAQAAAVVGWIVGMIGSIGWIASFLLGVVAQSGLLR